MSVAEELDRLWRLRIEGALSEEEFAAAKGRVLGETAPVGAPREALRAQPRTTLDPAPERSDAEHSSRLRLLEERLRPLVAEIVATQQRELNEDTGGGYGIRSGDAFVQWILDADGLFTTTFEVGTDLLSAHATERLEGEGYIRSGEYPVLETPRPIPVDELAERCAFALELSGISGDDDLTIYP